MRQSPDSAKRMQDLMRRRSEGDAAAERELEELGRSHIFDMFGLFTASAVYLHGLAGDVARDLHGEASMVATDMIECVGEALAVCAAVTQQQVCLSAAMKSFTTHSAEETTELGRRLAAELKPGRIVLLRGDLGAGKTTLVKGIAEGFQAAKAEDVTSPTFTLIHEYRGPEVTLFHIDLYRIDTQRELDTLALDDLMTPHSILLIEWGEKFEQVRQESDVEIAIEHRGADDRVVTIKTQNL